MSSGYDTSKKYGKHKYDERGQDNCQYGCGCWMGSDRSDSHVPGVDPFGECPKNPADGKLLGGNADFELVVNRRIYNLESALYQAQTKLKAVKPGAKRLAEENQKLREIVFALEGRLLAIVSMAKTGDLPEVSRTTTLSQRLGGMLK